MFSQLHGSTLLPRRLSREDAGWAKSVIGDQGWHLVSDLATDIHRVNYEGGDGEDED
jgi:hypothetical protein